MFKLLVTGSRDWKDRDMLWQVLDQYLPRKEAPVILIHGNAEGADTHASQWAKYHAAYVYEIAMDAKWDYRADKSAGPQRNSAMLDLIPNAVCAFYKYGAVNRGTANCVAEAKRRGIPVFEYNG